MTQLKDAVMFAVDSHAGQKYGSRPYWYHLNKVYEASKKHGGNEIHHMACWLHDTIEDTEVTKQILLAKFGKSVATIVDLVSNQSSKEATFKRIRSSKDAVFVKLCDRLANVSEGKKNAKYKKEHPMFREILYREGEFDDLWAAIDAILGYTVPNKL